MQFGAKDGIGNGRDGLQAESDRKPSLDLSSNSIQKFGDLRVVDAVYMVFNRESRRSRPYSMIDFCPQGISSRVPDTAKKIYPPSTLSAAT